MSIVADSAQTEPTTSSATAMPTPNQPFTEAELATLRLFCDTLIPKILVDDDPDGFYARQASDIDLASKIVEAIGLVASPDMVQQLRLFLRLLEVGAINALLISDGRSFSAMDLKTRIRLLHSYRTSRLNLRRKAFQSLKRLAMFIYYGATDESGQNPNWKTFDYPLPPLRDQHPNEPISKIVPLAIHQDTVLYADVVVVGSGAGGGVMAGELSAAGLEVIVVEKGGYYAEPDFHQNELHSTERLYENRGLVTTDDLATVIIAGSTLGGGTVVNWSASLRTPDMVLEEWARDYGVSDFLDDHYQHAMDAVSEKLHINTEESIPNRQNTILEEGAQKCGLDVGIIPRNTKGCGNCGFCNYGCPIGAKQSTLRTYLLEAHHKGTRIIVNAHVDQVLIQQGQAHGIKATVTQPDGTCQQVTIKAKTVVVSAGALHTPAILMRSGLTNEHIGRNLHLHPTTFTFGLYDAPVEGWSGKIMSRYVSSLRNMDGLGYGAILETAPIHPSLSALVLPWRSPRNHKETMTKLKNFSGIIVLTRDRDGGRVTLDKWGKPRYHYTLSDYDREHMLRGIGESIRVHHAAGAQRIGTSIEPLPDFTPTDDLDSYVDQVMNSRLIPNRYALLTAHQMSSCRMGGHPSLGAVKPSGETYEVKGLYVADASVFPTASGVNPMLTIMSVVYTIAQHIKHTHRI